MRPPRLRSIALVVVVVVALGGCGSSDQLGFAVALSIDVASDVPDPTVAAVKQLVFHGHGDETTSYTVPLDRPLGRTERIVYRPQPSTRELTITVDALDASGASVLAGTTTPLSVEAGRTTTAELTLEAATGDLGVGDGGDGSADDLGPAAVVSFVAARPIFDSNGVTEITAADLNADGRDDVIVASNGTVQIFFAKSDGTIPSGPNTQISLPGVAGIAAGHFRNATAIDLLAMVPGSAGFAFIDNDNGVFTAQTVTPVTGNVAVTEVAVADLDKDGLPDFLMSAASSDAIYARFSSSAPAYSADTTILTQHPVARIRTADLDDDGYLDVLAIENSSGVVETFRNTQSTAARTFSTVTNTLAPGDDYPTDTAIADLSGDGKPDIVVTGSNVDVAAYYVNNGAGTFSQSTDLMLGVDSPEMATFADLDGDGDLDLVTVHDPSATPYEGVRVSLNQGGTLGTPVYYAMGDAPNQFVLADTDGDGKDDLVVASQGGSTVEIARNLGGGRFYAAPMVLPPSSIGAPGRPLFANVVGDANLDLLIPNGSAALLLRGDGTGDFASLVSITAPAMSLAVGDLRQLGRHDLVIGCIAGCVDVALDEGSSLGAITTTSIAGSFADAAIADLDGDGHEDVIAVDKIDGMLDVFYGDGSGSLSTDATRFQQYGFTMATPNSVLVIDVNRDGRLDVLVPLITGAVDVFLGDVDRKLDSPTDYPISGNPTTVVVTDVDGDGNLDFIADGLALAIFHGIGDGTFSVGPTVSNGGDPAPFQTLALADVDRDGVDEVLATSSDGMHVYRVAGGSLSPVGVFAVGANPAVLVAADVNGDHLADAFSASLGTAALVINDSH